MANVHQDNHEGPGVLRTIQQLQRGRPLSGVPCYGKAVALGYSSSSLQGLKHIGLMQGEGCLRVMTRTVLEDLERKQRHCRRYIVDLEWEEREFLDLYPSYIESPDWLASAVVGALLVGQSSSTPWPS